MVSTGAKSSVRILPVGRVQHPPVGGELGQVVAQLVALLHLGGAGEQLGLRQLRPVIADRDDVAAAVVEIDRGKHALQRRRRRVEQHGRGLDVLHHHAAGVEPRLHQRVELLGQQVERHERPAVGVDQDDVPLLVVLEQKGAAVGHHGAQPRGLLELEVFLGELDHVLVELDGEDAGVGQRGAQIGHRAPAAEPDFGDALDLRRIGHAERHVAGVFDRQRARIGQLHAAFGVVALVLAERHGDGVGVAEDEDVVVERLALFQQAVGRGNERLAPSANSAEAGKAGDKTRRRARANSIQHQPLQDCAPRTNTAPSCRPGRARRPRQIGKLWQKDNESAAAGVGRRAKMLDEDVSGPGCQRRRRAAGV